MFYNNPAGWNRLSSAAVPDGARLSLWRETANSLFPSTQVRGASEDTFDGALSWTSVGSLTLAEFVSADHEILRGVEDIRRDDSWCEVSVQISGACQFSQAGRTIEAGPRTIILYDSQQPYRMSFAGPYRQLALKIPRAALRDRAPCLDRLIARPVSAERLPGRLFYDMMIGLCELGADCGAPALADRIEKHLLDLLTTALLDLPQDQAISIARQSQLVRVKAYILDNLDDPELSPSQIARAQNISLRSLYELFESEEAQVAQWIKSQRLEKIRRDLCDPLMRGWPITTIALRRGFKDFSHFSRVFRARYGLPPRDFRRQQQDRQQLQCPEP